MGTRNIIAKENKHGAITAVYCHWDGYLEHNGRILLQHYSDTERLIRLLKHGSMSVLGAELGGNLETDNKPNDHCVFYARDRGLPLEVASLKTRRKLIAFASQCGAEYIYLYGVQNGQPQWTFASRGAQFFGQDDGSPFSGWRDLSDAVRSCCSGD